MFLLTLSNLGVDITALIAGLGVGGIAIALATQNILGDLLASLAIVLDKPFAIKDFIIVGDLMGSVEHIGLKTTGCGRCQVSNSSFPTPICCRAGFATTAGCSSVEWCSRSGSV